MYINLIISHQGRTEFINILICIFIHISEGKWNFFPSKISLSHLSKITVLNETFIYNIQELLSHLQPPRII